MVVFISFLDQNILPWWAGVIALVTSIPVIFLYRYADKADDRAGVKWQHSSIYWYYGTAIPESVLKTAVAVKKRLPAAHLWVEHIDDGKDPFFGITHRKQEIYMDVWGEPDFEAQTQ